MPRSHILNMFGHSPIRPLQLHMAKTFACVENLIPFFAAVYKKDWTTAHDVRIGLTALETEADNIKKDLRLHLPKGLFLPVPRSDILTILTKQDAIANRAKDISGLILGRQMEIPNNIADSYNNFLLRCIDTAAQAHKAIQELDELLETGFRGREAQLVEEMIIELDKIEHGTDEMQIEVRRQLFMIEKNLSPIDVMFLYKIIEWTGDLADRSQSVGGQLLLLIAQ